MKIKWFGHSCFLLTSDSGVRVLTDPFNEKVGYKLPEVEADIVTVSHNHYDHDNVGIVKGRPAHINRPGTALIENIKITGVKTFHDSSEGAKRGGNVVFVFDIDGLRLCHCGDLGHIPAPGQVTEIGRVDILFLPVGGTYTVDAAGALEVAKLLKPAVTIPMHFKTEVMDFPIVGVDRYLELAGGGRYIGRQEIEVERGNLQEFAGNIVLEYV